MLAYADMCAPQPAHAPALAKPVAAIFNADEEEDEKERERAMRKKMKLERIDYGEHALDVDKKVFFPPFFVSSCRPQHALDVD